MNMKGKILSRLSISSSKNIRVLDFIFRCVIHFELILVKDVRLMSRWRWYYFCIWMSNCPSTVYRKDLISPLNCPCSFVKYQLTLIMQICSALSALFRLSPCLVLHQCCSILITIALQKSWSQESVLWLLFSVMLSILGHFLFCINFKVSLLRSVK